MMALVALAHNKLEWPKCCNQEPTAFNGQQLNMFEITVK